MTEKNLTVWARHVRALQTEKLGERGQEILKNHTQKTHTYFECLAYQTRFRTRHRLAILIFEIQNKKKHSKNIGTRVSLDVGKSGGNLRQKKIEDVSIHDFCLSCCCLQTWRTSESSWSKTFADPFFLRKMVQCSREQAILWVSAKKLVKGILIPTCTYKQLSNILGESSKKKEAGSDKELSCQGQNTK